MTSTPSGRPLQKKTVNTPRLQPRIKQLVFNSVLVKANRGTMSCLNSTPVRRALLCTGLSEPTPSGSTHTPGWMVDRLVHNVLIVQQRPMPTLGEGSVEGKRVYRMARGFVKTDDIEIPFPPLLHHPRSEHKWPAETICIHSRASEDSQAGENKSLHLVVQSTSSAVVLWVYGELICQRNSCTSMR